MISGTRILTCDIASVKQRPGLEHLDLRGPVRDCCSVDWGWGPSVPPGFAPCGLGNRNTLLTAK